LERVSEPSVDIEIGGVKTTYWAEIWQHRELLYILTWRDLLARYKQTTLGAAWSILRPLLTMLVFTLIMRVGRFPTSGAPPAVFVWSGLLPWLFFASGLNDSSASVMSAAHILTKIYFPRLMLPISALLACLFDMGISFLLLLLLAAFLHFTPSRHIFALPIFVILLFAMTGGLGLYCAAESVKYRDLRQIIPVLIQLGVYATPVFYPVEVIGRVIPSKFLPIYSLNPMVGLIEGFRWSIVGRSVHLDPIAISISVIETILILGFGLRHYRKTEMTFADNI
jgi:lipopolysaccharide transport system permease protein